MRRLSSVRLIQRPFANVCAIGAIAATVLGQGLAPQRAMAQLAACQPPTANEYLLLAVTPDSGAQARVTSILPASARTTVCNYLGETVMRIGDFSTQESANAWAEYIAQQAQVSAFVAKPPASGQTGVLPPSHRVSPHRPPRPTNPHTTPSPSAMAMLCW